MFYFIKSFYVIQIEKQKNFMQYTWLKQLNKNET